MGSPETWPKAAREALSPAQQRTGVVERAALAGAALHPHRSRAASLHVPQCRAGWTRHLLSGLRPLPPAVAERVLVAVPVAQRRQVEESISMRWLPFEVHMSVLQALRSALGPLGYRKLFAAQVWASLHHPGLFAKPARAALRFYCGGPFTVFRALPPSLRYVFRDAGQLRVSIAQGGHELTACYEDLPARFSEGDTWALSWQGTFEALAAYAFQGHAWHAHIDLVRHQPAQGYFEWRARTSLRR